MYLGQQLASYSIWCVPRPAVEPPMGLVDDIEVTIIVMLTLNMSFIQTEPTVKDKVSGRG